MAQRRKASVQEVGNCLVPTHTLLQSSLADQSNMKSSLPRNLQRTLSRYNSAASSAAKITNPSPSCSPSYGVPSPNSRNLPPVRYHLFREPLPYPVGLKLQSDIIDRRLALRDAGKGKGRAEGSGNPGSQDVLLLLGKSLIALQDDTPYCVSFT